MEPTTKILRKSKTIETGIFKIDKYIGLSKIHSIKITKIKPLINATKELRYKIIVDVSHPEFLDISFSFWFTPEKNEARNFQNKHERTLCMGETPFGELKDIIIASLSHESYAYQISTHTSAWLHAEKNPNNTEYLLWHYIYYGKYSNRLKWELPTRCVREKLWKINKCKLCEGSKCKFLLFKCGICKSKTKNLCPLCKKPVCNTHSSCENGHYVLNKDGMFEGKCTVCDSKIPIGIKICNTCNNENIKRY